MSLFRLLHAELSCQRCEERFPTTVQFRTGRNDNLQEYTAGKRLPELFREDLKEGRLYEAMGDRFCPSCLSERKLEEIETFYDTLAELVRSGRLKLARSAWLFAPKLRPAELFELGEERREEMKTLSLSQQKPPIEDLADFVVSWRGRRVRPDTAAFEEMATLIQERVNQELSEKSWPPGGLVRLDLVVVLSGEHALTVQVLPEDIGLPV
jgi:hypothetical protein